MVESSAAAIREVVESYAAEKDVGRPRGPAGYTPEEKKSQLEQMKSVLDKDYQEKLKIVSKEAH